MTWAAICLAWLIPAAEGPFAVEVVAVPRQVVAGEALVITARYRTPGATATLNAEVKDLDSIVLSREVRMVAGAGEVTFRLTALAGGVRAVRVAVWLGEDWRQPLAPIVHIDPLAVLSAARAVRLAEREGEAPALWQTWAAARTDEGLVGLWAGPDEGAAELAEGLAGRLRAGGLGAVRLADGALVNPAAVVPAQLDALVLCGGETLPAEAGPVLAGFVAAGGNLAVLGGPVGQTLRYELEGAWVTAGEYRERVARGLTTRPLWTFDDEALGALGRSSNQMANPSTARRVAGGAEESAGCLELAIRGLSGWDTFALPAVAAPFAEGETLTCFWAKGDGRTEELALEWGEADGSRWIATVPLTDRWQPYALPPEAFRYWQSVPARANDRFRPAQATRLTVGLAFTHTAVGGGDHTVWLDTIGTATADATTEALAEVLASGEALAPLEGLAPAYKFYEVTNLARLRPTPGQPLAVDALPTPAATRALHPRPGGTGWQKARPWRFVSLLEALDAEGRHVGDAAALVIQRAGGAVLSAPIPDPAWWRTDAAGGWAAAAVRWLLEGFWFEEGGAAWYAGFGGETLPLGATVQNRGRAPRDGTITLRVEGADGRELWARTEPVTVPAGGAASVTGTLPALPAAGDERLWVTAELRAGEAVRERLRHEVLIWRPSAAPVWTTARAGHFWRGGERLVVHGVNYMPSSGIGLENGELFEYWLDPAAYDPEIIERDLDDCAALGFNLISVFCYYRSRDSHNLIHLLTAARARGLLVNLSIRPGSGLDFRWDEMRAIVEANRIAENDTVIAYDIAWEPHWGNFDRRRVWDGRWRDWLTATYGGVAAAEAVWGCPAARLGDEIVGPSDAQVAADGPHRPMVLAYRRFQHELLDTGYRNARDLLRSIDPRHLVSFRMSMAGDPTSAPGWLGYDFDHLREAVDILQPEAYGRIGDWSRVRPGGFTVAYARAVAPDLPVLWAEFGRSVWDRNRHRSDPDEIAAAGQYYRDFYRMAHESDSDGTVCWWFPGGYRVGERSDFGIQNPDRTWRPIAQAIHDWSTIMTTPPPARTPDHWIPIDPTASLNGIESIYRQVGDAWWEAIEAGQVPGLRVEGR